MTAGIVPDKSVRLSRSSDGGSRTRWAPLATLLAVQALLVGIPLVRGSWFADDLFNAAVVQGRPLDWTFMSRDFFGHFLPLAQVPLWVAGHLVLHHTAVALVELVGVLACTALLVAVLRELVGDRPALVHGIAVVYITTPITLPSILWWASAFELVPAHFCVLLAVLLHLKWLRTKHFWLLPAIALVVAVGICFWDLVNLVIVWLPLLTLALKDTTTAGRLRRVVAAWPAWVAVLLPLVAYQWLYSQHKHGSPTTPGLSLLARFLGNGWFRGFVPGLTGGPIVWRYSGYGYFATSNVPLVLVVLSQLSVLAFLVASLRRSAASLWSWLLIASAVLPPLLLVAVGRLGLLGPDIGRDFRYLSLTAVPALLGVALVIDTAWPVERPHQRFVGLGAVAVVVLLGLVSAIRYDVAWDKLPVDRYLSTIAADAHHLDTGKHPITVIDENVPPAVQVDYFGPGTARMSWVLSSLRVKGLRYDGEADQPYQVTQQGHVIPARLATAAVLPPTKARCTRGGKRQVLRFASPAQLPWISGYVVRFTLTGSAPVMTSARMLKELKPLPAGYYDNRSFAVRAGSHQVVLTQNGTPFNGTDLLVDSAKPVCISGVEIDRVTAP